MDGIEIRIGIRKRPWPWPAPILEFCGKSLPWLSCSSGPKTLSCSPETCWNLPWNRGPVRWSKSILNRDLKHNQISSVSQRGDTIWSILLNPFYTKRFHFSTVVDAFFAKSVVDNEFPLLRWRTHLLWVWEHYCILCSTAFFAACPSAAKRIVSFGLKEIEYV